MAVHRTSGNRSNASSRNSFEVVEVEVQLSQYSFNMWLSEREASGIIRLFLEPNNLFFLKKNLIWKPIIFNIYLLQARELRELVFQQWLRERKQFLDSNNGGFLIQSFVFFE